jgi:TrmH family RNA methyltransferase
MSRAGTVPIRVVLVRPLHPGNVGGAIRAAANFAADEIVVVGHPLMLEDPEVRRMAMGGEAFVRVGSAASLSEALQNCQLAVATTSARQRERRNLRTVEWVRNFVLEHPVERLALVFGSESGGLNRAEMRLCNAAVTAPTNPDFGVLNLAQAVAVFLAQLAWRPIPPAAPADPLDDLASSEELIAAADHLEAELVESGFLDPHNPARVGDQLRALLGSAAPSRRQLAVVRALAAHIGYLRGVGQPALSSASGSPRSARDRRDG